MLGIFLEKEVFLGHLFRKNLDLPSTHLGFRKDLRAEKKNYNSRVAAILTNHVLQLDSSTAVKAVRSVGAGGAL